MEIYCSNCGKFINDMHFKSSKNEIKLRKKYKEILSKIICRQCYTNGGRQMRYKAIYKTIQSLDRTSENKKYLCIDFCFHYIKKISLIDRKAGVSR